MSIRIEQVLAAAEAAWIGQSAVTEGFHGIGVTVAGTHLVVAFRWKQHPREFQIRLPTTDLQHGMWTGLPTATAEDWVNEASGRLMEELDTGATHWAVRHERDGRIELDLDAGPPARGVYYVGAATSECASWLREQGLDVAKAVKAEARGVLRTWLQMYVNNAHGEPVVAHTVIVDGGASASVEVLALEVVADVPLADVTRLAHHAFCVAAEAGADRISCSFSHPALLAAGMQPAETGGLILNVLEAWPLPDALNERDQV